MAILGFLAMAYPSQTFAQLQIRINNTGGACQLLKLGVWNLGSRTCKLTADVQGSIEIMDNGIMLDGNNKTLTPGAGDTVGITIDGKGNITVKHLTIKNFTKAIWISGGKKNTLESNTITDTARPGCAICLDDTKENELRGNSVVDNHTWGVMLSNADLNVVKGNTLERNELASVYAVDSSENRLLGNILIGKHGVIGKGMAFQGGQNNVIEENTIKDHRDSGICFHMSNQNVVKYNKIADDADGLKLEPAMGSRVWCNDFSGHGRGVDILRGSVGNEIWLNNFLNVRAADAAGVLFNEFNHARPEGGNYWEVHAPNCHDLNRDRVCDAPFVFRGNQDNLPHVGFINWLLNRSICEEPGGMDPFTVSADAIGRGIDSTGHIAIYGIYFDTDSAKIKPESSATLEEISKLLSQKPDLKLLVVGDTDKQGSYEHNMGLSQRRGEAVVQALVSKHGIAASRLKSAGVGYLSPVATNDTEEGRAKNRRVELVKQ